MSSDRPADYLVSLVHELCALPRETEWVEFKVNDAEPQAIGELISALANAAALVGTQRFLDTPPKSRNEALASLVLRFRICEERGSGIDKVVFQIELFQLAAPLFEVPEKNKATVSRYIREAVETGMIKSFDEDASRKLMKYVPFWA